MDVWIKNARILTMDDQFTEFHRADIQVRGKYITSVGPDLPTPEGLENWRIIDATGKLAMPGLVNGHFHSPGNIKKGASPGAPLEIWMLYDTPPLIDTCPDPEIDYWSTLLGAIEMIKLGVTSVHDDAYYIPAPTFETIDARMRAYAESGMRAVAALDQPNVVEYEKYPFLENLLPEKFREEMEARTPIPDEELLEMYRYLIEKWNGSCNGRLGAGVSVSAPQRVTTSYFQALTELSQQLDLPFSIHILETRLQRVLGDEKYGKSLIKYVEDLGFLIEQMMIIHAVWVDDNDLESIAQAGSVVAHNPICNLRLGSGIMPFRKIRDHGIPLCLGTDEMDSDDSVNVWDVAKLTGLIHNITDTEYRNWPKPNEILWSLTRGGARAMRNHNRVGMIAPGYEADLILLDLNTLSFTPLNSLHTQLIYNENGSSVILTMVAGEILMEDGKVLTVDEEAVKAEIRKRYPKIQKEIEKSVEAASQLEPYYRKMYFQAVNHPLSIDRWASPS